jgi:hypothetical protein
MLCCCPDKSLKYIQVCQNFYRLIRECDGDYKLSIRKSWGQFNIKEAILIRFSIYAFSV